jgi:hypothetical protein
MKKIMTVLLTVLLSFTMSAQAKQKPQLSIVMAGSPAGTFNAFNNEIAKDLAKYYTITKIPGQSEIKGNAVYQSITDRPVFIMTKTGFHNARTKSEGQPIFHSNLNKNFMVMGISYYKVLCRAAGKDIEEIFKPGARLKIGFDEGVGPSNKYIANFSRVNKSDHIMVPFKSSGKGAQAIITGDIDAYLINITKALKFTESKQFSCQYTQDPDGGFGWKPLKDRMNDNWFGWTYSHFLIGHVKNVDRKFAGELHKNILAIFNDPNSHASKRLKSGGWVGEKLSQDQIFARYQSAYENTLDLLK